MNATLKKTEQGQRSLDKSEEKGAKNDRYIMNYRCG